MAKKKAKKKDLKIAAKAKDEQAVQAVSKDFVVAERILANLNRVHHRQT
jgi:hypothetical protein